MASLNDGNVNSEAVEAFLDPILSDTSIMHLGGKMPAGFFIENYGHRQQETNRDTTLHRQNLAKHTKAKVIQGLRDIIDDDNN